MATVEEQKSTGFLFPYRGLEVGKKPNLEVKTRVCNFKRILKKDLLCIRSLSRKSVTEKLLSNWQKAIFLGILV